VRRSRFERLCPSRSDAGDSGLAFSIGRNAAWCPL
jgi:hypothetical protein